MTTPNKPTPPNNPHKSIGGKRIKTVQRRSVASLQLELSMMNALIAAGWNGDKIAGFIAAQRRDGVLQIIVPAHVLEIEREIWDKANAATVHVQTRIDQLTAKIEHAQTTAEPCPHT